VGKEGFDKSGVTHGRVVNHGYRKTSRRWFGKGSPKRKKKERKNRELLKELLRSKSPIKRILLTKGFV